MEFTSNKNLYKWKSADKKRDTITEMANNAQKIEDALVQIDSQLSDIASINNFSVIPTYTNGQLTKVEEKDGSIVKSSSTITYNSDGTVNTVTDVINGKTVVTTLNYVNGEFSSVSRAVI